ncbi:MAG: xanthine dehydrogenase family protein subunit M [Rhodobacteraceae bacterium]|nr:xanthine dehydrogenase family protein subunit M [Paracoccaceae bacterium]MCY4250514.1 xanthine dehydrogenase family protein subunit M [Paracoccaceae bacterium]MCY4308124.1 xanthine dehydrogenase family protein subunit M [Paracoccaceae bacterium]
MYDFALQRPQSLNEAIEALSVEGAQALAGGQTMIPTLKNRLASPDVLVSIGGISELQGVSETDGTVSIKAGTTHGVVAATVESYPALASLAGNIGDPAVRNRGTIGGSLANNDPSACYPAAALASNASITTNKRTISASDFFMGLFETSLDEGELITQVDFPVPDAANYQKFDQPASRFALVGVFVAKYGNDVRVAVTGASEDGVFRWSEAESALAGNFSSSAIDGLEVDPESMIEDIHGSRSYRANLVKVMTKRAVAAC